MKIRRVPIYLALIVCIFCSCERGYDLIERDKMLDILVDLQVADQVIRKYDPLIQDSIRQLLKESLLKVHGVTEAQLDTNIYIYQYDTEEYKKLSSELVEKLEFLRDNP